MICHLTPACKAYLWGGTTLKQRYGKTFAGDILAETWELSCHADGETMVADGPYAGHTLARLLAEQPALAGHVCAQSPQFPLLIKLIDARSDLSIQVHPDDAYALEQEGQLGKTEMWYVVEAEPNAALYYGFTHEITPEEFAARIADNTLTDVLRRVPVQAGDSFFIEAGTIHAIGAGIVIAEVQQSSNVTYRVYDYGRKGPDGKLRELHVEKATAVTALRPATTQYDFGGHLARCSSFTVDVCEVCDTLDGFAGVESFHSLLVLKGSGQLCCGSQTLNFAQGDSLFVAAQSGAYTVTGPCRLLLTQAGSVQ